MRIEVQKLFFISSILIFMLIIWEYSFMLYWKTLSVFLHESFHAIVGFLLGGKDISIVLNSPESGTTKMKSITSIAIPMVVSAGYLGNIIFGSFLLSKAFRYKQNRIISFLSANWIIISAMFFLDPKEIFYNYIIITGIILNIGALMGGVVSSLLTLYLGLTLLLYGVYDIYDIFMNPEITDAGIFAAWVLDKGIVGSTLRNIAMNIGIAWYALSAAIIFIFNRYLIFGEKTGEKRIDKMISLVNEGNVPKDVADWFLEKGKDLDGLPLSGENIKYLNRGTHE